MAALRKMEEGEDEDGEKKEEKVEEEVIDEGDYEIKTPGKCFVFDARYDCFETPCKYMV